MVQRTDYSTLQTGVQGFYFLLTCLLLISHRILGKLGLGFPSSVKKETDVEINFTELLYGFSELIYITAYHLLSLISHSVSSWTFCWGYLLSKFQSLLSFSSMVIIFSLIAFIFGLYFCIL